MYKELSLDDCKVRVFSTLTEWEAAIDSGEIDKDTEAIIYTTLEDYEKMPDVEGPGLRCHIKGVD